MEQPQRSVFFLPGSKVFSLFHQSLLPLGFMCLGTHESMDYSRTKAHFNTIIEPQRIYRKCD